MKLGFLLASVAAVAAVPAAQASSAVAVPFAVHNATEAMAPLALTAIVFQMCGVDIVGQDVLSKRSADPNQCVALCGATGASTWTDFENGTCWCKNVNNKMPATSVNTGAASSFILVGGGIIPLGRKDDADMPGFDVGSVQRGTVDECLTPCASNPKCFAFTWTNFNGGTCWLKSRASNFVPSQGAIAGYLARPLIPTNGCPRL